VSILSIGGAVQALSNMAFWAFMASGNARQLLLSGMVTKPLLVSCVVIGSLSGIQGIAWGYSAGLVISWFIQLAWLKRCDAMPVLAFLRSGVYVMLCGLAAGGIGWMFVNHMSARVPQLVLLGIGFILVSSIYVPLLMSNARIRGLLLDIIKPAFARMKTVLLRA